jgi:hypothetical protein
LFEEVWLLAILDVWIEITNVSIVVSSSKDERYFSDFKDVGDCARPANARHVKASLSFGPTWPSGHIRQAVRTVGRGADAGQVIV